MARPRIITPPPEEMEKLGEEMIAYVSDKKNKVLHLSEWWSTKMFFIEKVWNTMCIAPEFLPYYEKALRIIGKQYLDKTSNVRDGISQRWQRVYFKDLKKEEDETAVFNASISDKEKSSYNEDDKTKIENIHSQLSAMSETLNNSRNNNNKDV